MDLWGRPTDPPGGGVGPWTYLVSVSALYVVCRHGVCGPRARTVTHIRHSIPCTATLCPAWFSPVAANSLVGRASHAPRAPRYDEGLPQPLARLRSSLLLTSHGGGEAGGGWTLDFCACPADPPGRWRGGLVLGPWAFQKVQPTLWERGVGPWTFKKSGSCMMGGGTTK